MDFGLNDEQQMIVDTVRSFVENEIYPLEDDVERTGQVPQEIGEEIKRKVLELGVFAPNMPCLLYTSPSPRDRTRSRMPSSA